MSNLWKIGHIAFECYHRNNFSYQGTPPPPSLIATTSQTNASTNEASTAAFTNDHGIGFTTEENWILDSCATHHMTTNLNNLNHISPYNSGAKITIRKVHI